MNETILEVQDLSVSLQADGNTYPILDGIHFSLQSGEVLALVGESGSGKSITALSLTRLLPSNLTKYQAKSIRFFGRDLWEVRESEMQKIRGREIAYIFQEPFSSFNPIETIGNQLCEGMLVHGLGNFTQAKKKAVQLLEEVGITDALSRFDAYPNQFSGGMLQRASIAMALMCDPKLLIADEPTSAIDVTIQLQIMELLVRLQKERNLAVLFISHDMGLVSYFADRIAVLYAGRIVEIGTTEEILENPRHPYTQALVRAYPSESHSEKKLFTIGGQVPPPSQYPKHCRFADRCPARFAPCTQERPSTQQISPTHSVACFLESSKHA